MSSGRQSDIAIPLLWSQPDSQGRVLGGIDFQTLMRRSLIDDDATHITSTQNILLMLNSIDMTDDEAHALGARRLHRGFASIGLRAMLSTATLGTALEVLSRYFAACSSVFRLEVTREGSLAQIAFRAEGAGGATGDSSRGDLVQRPLRLPLLVRGPTPSGVERDRRADRPAERAPRALGGERAAVRRRGEFGACAAGLPRMAPPRQ